jgi:hypothetical protein
MYQTHTPNRKLPGSTYVLIISGRMKVRIDDGTKVEGGL